MSNRKHCMQEQQCSVPFSVLHAVSLLCSVHSFSRIGLVSSQCLQAQAEAAAANSSEAEAGYKVRGAGGAPRPLAPRLATLSALPRTQWHNLVHLDAIRDRSRPVQPPKKPEAAPFFLPTLAGAEPSCFCGHCISDKSQAVRYSHSQIYG